MKRAKKYNIIIYGCLFLAIILLGLGGLDYLKTPKETTTVKEPEEEETKPEIERVEPEEKKEEPDELKNVDKAGIIKKYLDSIVDQIQKDKTLDYKMIKTWGDYSVGEVEYQREITSKYYEYKVNIMIPKLDAKLPSKKNEKLSTEEYIVLTMYFDIVDSQRANGFIVKNIDLIKE